MVVIKGEEAKEEPGQSKGSIRYSVLIAGYGSLPGPKLSLEPAVPAAIFTKLGISAPTIEKMGGTLWRDPEGMRGGSKEISTSG